MNRYSILRIVFASALSALAVGVSPASAATERKLSNETTKSVWAYVADTQDVKSTPSFSARTVTKLHYNTEDKLPEIYLVLSSIESNGREWVKIRLPRRPNGSTGWVLRESLGEYHRTSSQLILDKSDYRLTLKRNGTTIFTTRVGIGKDSTATPNGRFYIREKFRSTNPFYGPYVFGTSAYAPGLTDWPGGGVIGLHGTNQPGILPGKVSHGCVRMKNTAVIKLYKILQNGTPFLVKD